MAKRAAKAKSKKGKESRTGVETKAGFLSAAISEADVRDYVVAELRYASPVAFTAEKFSAPAEGEPQADKLNDVLAKYDIAALRSQFGLKASVVRERIEVAKNLTPKASSETIIKQGVEESFFQSNFVQIVPKNDKDAAKIARDLQRQAAVWQAYVAPRPVPAAVGSEAGSRNFEPAQGNLHSPPNGIGAVAVWSAAGAKGDGITICDIEGNWNRSHEDLPAGIPLLGGTVINNVGWRNHGTAVLGEMIATPNKIGTVGIAHKAKAAVHSAIINGVFNTAGAITAAASNLKAGDAILIELQATGPNNKYVAMQFWDDVFSAIVAATAKGITVVEAAGNGNENFDLAIFNGTGLQKDSGAIVVGAGIPPTNYFDFDNNYQEDRGAALAHLVLELRQDPERARLGLACHHAGLWRRPRRGVRKHVVHPPLLGNVEHFADRHGRGGLLAGTREGQEWPAIDPRQGPRNIDEDRHAASRRSGRSADPADRAAGQPARGDEARLKGRLECFPPCQRRRAMCGPRSRPSSNPAGVMMPAGGSSSRNRAKPSAPRAHCPSEARSSTKFRR